MTWTCIPVAVIACGAFVVSPLPHRAAFIHAHPIPARNARIASCMAWALGSIISSPVSTSHAPRAIPAVSTWPLAVPAPEATAHHQPQSQSGVSGTRPGTQRRQATRSDPVPLVFGKGISRR